MKKFLQLLFFLVPFKQKLVRFVEQRVWEIYTLLSFIKVKQKKKFSFNYPILEILLFFPNSDL